MRILFCAESVFPEVTRKEAWTVKKNTSLLQRTKAQPQLGSMAPVFVSAVVLLGLAVVLLSVLGVFW